MKSSFPIAILNQLRTIQGFNETEFLNCQVSMPAVSIRKNPLKWKEIEAIGRSVPWCSDGIYLDSRPEFIRDPFFHAGHYYVQEASSMFVGELFQKYCNDKKAITVLDLCAAPGGKSTHILSVLDTDSILIANEVSPKRASILKENLTRWGSSNVIVTNNSIRDFANLENYFDVILVDAPCSGSGLFRKMPEFLSEWSEGLVQQSVHRQKEILHVAKKCLKPDGFLLYSTCSFSIEENEDRVRWMVDEEGFSEIDCSKVELNGICKTAPSSFRFFPDKTEGEGFFVSLLKKKSGLEKGVFFRKNSKKIFFQADLESGFIRDWIKSQENLFFEKSETTQKRTFFYFPWARVADLEYIDSKLRIIKKGVRVGDYINKDFVPDHEFALSNMVADNVPSKELEEVDFFSYLNKLKLDRLTTSDMKLGFFKVHHKGASLGWAKNLGKRINNYFPNEWRVIKNL